MLPSKPKSGLNDTSNTKTTPATPNSTKTTPATPKVSKLSRAGSTRSDSGSPSPIQNPRLSPKTADSKPTVERRSPKITTPPPDKHVRATKGSELQSQLTLVQEELMKVKEELASVEQEKLKAVEELKDAKKSADEANEKLKEALVAQQRAEESSEIEKFRADEMEQAGIEAAQKKEEEWQKELETLRNQQSVDAAALLSAAQELQKVRQDLEDITNAKNAALGHADDAMKIAEINAEKVEFLSTEVSRLKSLLDSELESVNNEASELVQKLNSEVNTLKGELERAKAAEEKLPEMEALIEGLKTEVTDAKRAEMEAHNLVHEWKKKAEALEVRVEEANQSEKASLESLASVSTQLEESNGLLQDSESKVAALTGKVDCLEIEITRHKEELKDLNHSLDLARQEASESGKVLESLKSELKILEEEKLQALTNLEAAVSDIDSLSEERNRLMDELEISREEREKMKKAMEGMASALHEVSSEARENQERLLTKQAESEDAHAQIEQLRSALRNTEEHYEVTLDEARYEIVCLKKSVERFETEAKDSREEWDAKELNFVSVIKRSEEELASLKSEREKMVGSLKGAEEAARGDGDEMLAKLQQAELRVNAANEAVEDAKAQTLQLKERLLDKENELQSISQENDELRAREAAAVEKAKELSALLAEAKAKKASENGDLSSSEKEYDLLPSSTEILVESMDKSKVEKSRSEAPSGLDQKLKEENGSGNGTRHMGEEESMEVEFKVRGNSGAVEGSPVEVEQDGESVDDELEAKRESDGFDQIDGLSSETMDNGATSPGKKQQKKKKALLHKVGSLLKKKSNHK